MSLQKELSSVKQQAKKLVKLLSREFVTNKEFNEINKRLWQEVKLEIDKEEPKVFVVYLEEKEFSLAVVKLMDEDWKYYREETLYRLGRTISEQDLAAVMVFLKVEGDIIVTKKGEEVDLSKRQGVVVLNGMTLDGRENATMCNISKQGGVSVVVGEKFYPYTERGGNKVKTELLKKFFDGFIDSEKNKRLGKKVSSVGGLVEIRNQGVKFEGSLDEL